MIARIKTASIQGIDALSVEAEVHLKKGQRRISIIGLADSAVREAKDRVQTAMRHSGVSVKGDVLVNLSPAEVRKEGAHFDLPIAIGVLVAARAVSYPEVKDRSFFGELALDGRIKPVRGILALTINSLQRGIKEVIVPLKNKREAELLPGIKITAVSSLAQLIAYLKGRELPERKEDPLPAASPYAPILNGFSDVWGQHSAKRALTIAAAGGHNILMIGPPGCGKSMLAQRFPTILPPLSSCEKLEVIKIHSVAGAPVEGYLSGVRPYRHPHHLVSDAGLIGGGSIPKPGEISLAHNGVLFLDEFPEFRRSALEALRQPMESGLACISRAKANLAFPASFQLIAAMNPCPCGRLGIEGNSCLCSRSSIAAYLKKLSQPILDRIDLHVELAGVPVEALTGAKREGGEFDSPAEIVHHARKLQVSRQGKVNALLSGEEIAAMARIKPHALRLLEQAAKKTGLSARTFVRILRVSFSIADMEGASQVDERHVAEAIGFRSLERLQSCYCM
ncbi:MAG: YifB family Mg chelatase-like AAA ATPase [Deltaproteobacteria bacterium]|nr:YifB family Mg chelatase-like AAA ATPase [Deltaproteobacteria bacterium]